MSFRTIIVDDEPLARRGLALRMDGVDDVEIVAQCGNGRSALVEIAKLKPDLVFLDIQMPGMDGLDVIKALPDTGCFPEVVFVTAYDQYAVSAFQAHALDYLLKPIEDARLEQSLDRVRQQAMNRAANTRVQNLIAFVAELTGEPIEKVTQKVVEGRPLVPPAFRDVLKIKDGGDVTNVPMPEIDWVDAAGDYMCVHAQGETHIMRSTMKELEKQLDPQYFQRVHRSTIVNLGRVKKVCSHINGEYFLVLDNGTEIKMSRSYKAKIRHFR